MKAKRGVVLLALAIVLVGASVWLALRPHDPHFRGKPESEWINGIAYGMSLSDSENREQAQRWRELGPGGLRVLERALHASPGRTYRKAYRRHAGKLPRFLARMLPLPKMDGTRATRMRVLDLLSRMGKDAWPAWPAVARALDDEDSSVRQIAITFFTSSENDQAFLNQIPAPVKQKLLPSFLRALESNGENWGVRNNAALALRYYPEQARLVGPALTNAFQDAAPHVRLVSAETLHRVDPNAAKQAGAVTVLSNLVKDPDDQIASRAASALRQFQNEAESAVAALVEALHGTNINVGCHAVWSLEWGFPAHTNTIIPELRKAAERKDNVGGYARSALKHLESGNTMK